ncbi:M14-type cytosolic carboxypeptidase [soil metagenome]
MTHLRFTTDFESGNGINFHNDGFRVQFEIRPDTNSDDRQWFYFRVEGATRGEILSFHLLHTDQSNMPIHWDHARPVAAPDQPTNWRRVNGVTAHWKDNNEFVFEHECETDVTYFAFHYPYTHSDLVKKIGGWAANSNVARTVIGKSVEGRAIDALRITEGGAKDKVGIWLTSRQHAAETCASFFFEGFIDWLLSEDTAAIHLRKRAVINAVPMLNPDGVVSGNYRDNSQGVNLNRVWNSPDPKTSPEIFAITAAVKKWVDAGNRFDFYADLHGDSEALSNYAFHARPGVAPPLYPNPAQYGDDSIRFLNLVAKYNDDFNPNEGDSDDETPLYSRQFMTHTYGVLGVLFENTYTYFAAGPHSKSFITPDRHRALGKAFGEALVEYHGL